MIKKFPVQPLFDHLPDLQYLNLVKAFPVTYYCVKPKKKSQMSTLEFAKLRALRAHVPYMSTCLKVLRAYLLSCFTCLGAYNHSQNTLRHILRLTSIPRIAVFLQIILPFIPFKTTTRPASSKTTYLNLNLWGLRKLRKYVKLFTKLSKTRDCFKYFEFLRPMLPNLDLQHLMY